MGPGWGPLQSAPCADPVLVSFFPTELVGGSLGSEKKLILGTRDTGFWVSPQLSPGDGYESFFSRVGRGLPGYCRDRLRFGLCHPIAISNRARKATAEQAYRPSSAVLRVAAVSRRERDAIITCGKGRRSDTATCRLAVRAVVVAVCLSKRTCVGDCRTPIRAMEIREGGRGWAAATVCCPVSNQRERWERGSPGRASWWESHPTGTNLSASSVRMTARYEVRRYKVPRATGETTNACARTRALLI